MLTYRELPADEWTKLLEQGCRPYALSGLPSDNGHWRILVAEDETGAIVAHTAVHTQVHWEPWEIRPGHEGLGVVRGLIRQGRDLLRGLGIDHAYCTIDSAQGVTADQATRLGFEPAPGQLYLVNLAQLEDV